jgi:hypothetical protein
MIVFARGAITKPDELGPFVDDEMRVVKQLKDEGVMKAVYRRAAGPGVLLLLEGDSIDAVKRPTPRESRSADQTPPLRVGCRENDWRPQ